MDKWAGALPWRRPRSTGIKSRLRSGRHAVRGLERSEQSPLVPSRSGKIHFEGRSDEAWGQRECRESRERAGSF